MSDMVKETLCAHCSHRVVCSYKNDYLKILNDISAVTANCVNRYNFLNNVSVDCKYYLNQYEAYRLKESTF